MNIEQQLQYLFHLERAGMKYDLSNITRLCELLGNPQNDYKTIHIAGTNGKGSTAVFTQSLLTTSGYKTGLFVSPHVLKFNERISIDYSLISDEYILSYLEKYKNYFDVIKPSFFEATTALAFKYFSDMKVDYAVIETGLGGRLDSTNIIIPEVTCITTIGLDHKDYLGDTIEQIALEKAGIIKQGVPCVVGKMPVNALKVIDEVCKVKKSKLINSDEVILQFSELSEISELQQLNLKKACLICSEIQVKNLKIETAFTNALTNEAYRGRLEKVNDIPLIYVDVAHNEQAFEKLRHATTQFNYEKLYIIFGMMSDKDIPPCVLQIEMFNAEKIILTKANLPRAKNSEQLLSLFSQPGDSFVTQSLFDAFFLAKSFLNENDMLLVTGSFYVVGEFLEVLSQYKF